LSLDVSSTALVAEPSETFRASLEAIFEAAGWQVIGRSALDEARKDVAERAPGVVVTSLKLGGFNGIHLVYLAKLANPLAVCVVYGEADRAEEAQRAGAIYVDHTCIREALPDILDSMFRKAAEASKYLLSFPAGRGGAVDDLSGEKA
jgi:DNA-binding NarL/FixJ family response regulator